MGGKRTGGKEGSTRRGVGKENRKSSGKKESGGENKPTTGYMKRDEGKRL